MIKTTFTCSKKNTRINPSTKNQPDFIKNCVSSSSVHP